MAGGDSHPSPVGAGPGAGLALTALSARQDRVLLSIPRICRCCWDSLSFWDAGEEFSNHHQVTDPKDPRRGQTPRQTVPRLGVVSPGFPDLWSPPKPLPAGHSRGFTPHTGL